MDTEQKIEDWELLFRQRVSSSPQDISLDYAVQLTIALFQFRDLMKEIEEDHRDALAELDDSYNVNMIYNEKAQRIDLDVLDKICKALDCQPGDLLERVDD